MGKVPLIVPYRHDMSHNGEELRYALRSVCDNMPFIKDVILIGHELHAWAVGIDWYDIGDDSPNKDTNMFRKLDTVLHDNAKIDRFVLMADDNVVCAPMKSPSKIPVVHDPRGPSKFPMSVFTGPWGRRMLNTFKWIEHNGWDVPDVNYDSHCPQLFSAENIRGNIPWSWLDNGYGLCIYTTLRMLEHGGKPPRGVPKETVKRTITSKTLAQPYLDRLFLGYDDTGWTEDMVAVLKDRFPRCSRWEMPD